MIPYDTYHEQMLPDQIKNADGMGNEVKEDTKIVLCFLIHSFGSATISQVYNLRVLYRFYNQPGQRKSSALPPWYKP
jgi:hypothetical protein